MQGVFHFEISSEHIQRAQRFYKDVFDWNLLESNDCVDYLLINTNDINIPEINKRLDEPGDLFLTKINVYSIDEAMSKILKYGGRVLADVIETAKERKVYCEDTEGNLLVVAESI